MGGQQSYHKHILFSSRIWPFPQYFALPTLPHGFLCLQHMSQVPFFDRSQVLISASENRVLGVIYVFSVSPTLLPAHIAADM